MGSPHGSFVRCGAVKARHQVFDRKRSFLFACDSKLHHEKRLGRELVVSVLPQKNPYAGGSRVGLAVSCQFCAASCLAKVLSSPESFAVCR